MALKIRLKSILEITTKKTFLRQIVMSYFIEDFQKNPKQKIICRKQSYVFMHFHCSISCLF